MTLKTMYYLHKKYKSYTESSIGFERKLARCF